MQSARVRANVSDPAAAQSPSDNAAVISVQLFYGNDLLTSTLTGPPVRTAGIVNNRKDVYKVISYDIENTKWKPGEQGTSNAR